MQTRDPLLHPLWLDFKLQTSVQILWSLLFQVPCSNGPFLMVFPLLPMSILSGRTLHWWQWVKFISLLLATNMLGPVCESWPFPQFVMSQTPPPAYSLFCYSLPSADTRNTMCGIGLAPGKWLLQLHYCCGLKSHHTSTWHMPMGFGKKNRWLNGTVVHVPLDERSNFPRESISSTSNMGKLRKGEI